MSRHLKQTQISNRVSQGVAARSLRRRRVLFGLTLASLLVCLTLWASSYIRFYYRGEQFLISVYSGHIQYLYTQDPWCQRAEPERYHMGFYVLGFRWGTLWWPWHTIGSNYWTVHCPLWIPTLALSIPLPFLYLPLRRRRHRLRHGQCLSCGYSLTGLPEPRCPECGTCFPPFGPSALSQLNLRVVVARNARTGRAGQSPPR